MPINQRDLGKYKRNGIFIEEKDESLVELPIQNELVNLIPGFSRKGPFNNPTYIESQSEFKNIFGDIDKKLENRGSYFHRTALKMLETGPIWALNLLKVDSTNDLIDWKSISVSTGVDNKDGGKIPFDKIYSKQDFWERDDESLYDYLVKEKADGDADFYNRLVQLTNVGSKISTVFMYKSSATGFDVTCENWYGGKTKVPFYLRPEDYISDYMVSVVILEGDWTDYSALSVDSTWSTYFTLDGLDKTLITSFLNNSNVTTLEAYDCSLIPGFVDLNSTNLFIKDVINADTNTTGIFCSYDESVLNESEYPEGHIDIIGEGLVYTNNESVNFMSYNTKITEDKAYDFKELNSIGNIYGNYSLDLKDKISSVTSDRDLTTTNTYGYVDNTENKVAEYSSVSINGNTITTTTIEFASPQNIATGDVIYFTNTFSGIIKNTAYYAQVAGGLLTVYRDSALSDAVTLTAGVVTEDIYVFSKKVSFGSIDGVSDGYFVMDENYNIPLDTDITFTTFNNTSEFVNFDDEHYKVDVYYVEKGSNTILSSEGEFTIPGSGIVMDGSVININDTFVKLHTLNSEDIIVLGYTVLYFNDTDYKMDYFPVAIGDQANNATEEFTFTEFDSETITLSFNMPVGLEYEYLNNNNIKKKAYILDGLTNGSFSGFITETALKMPIESYTSINNDVTFKVSDSSDIVKNNGVFLYFSDNELVAPSTLKGFVTSSDASVTDYGMVGKASDLYTDFYAGNINTNDYTTINSIKYYLRMYFTDETNIQVDIMAGTDGAVAVDVSKSNIGDTLTIVSKLGNYKQSVELETVDTYTDLTNTRTIRVLPDRYGELVVDSFLEAYIPATDEDGSAYNSSAGRYMNGRSPRKLTKITKVVRVESSSETLLEITCDAPIKITDIGALSTELQVNSFARIEKYITHLNGIAMNPFVVRNESMPDGTDVRQSNILDVMGSGTNLFKGLINKNRITWRYLVDTFGLGLDTTAYPGGSKQQYVDLCGAKQNSFAFVSMPSARDFKRSANPSFVDDDGALSSAHVLTGGDISLNPGYLYEIGNGDGASAAGYFFPFVKVVDTYGIEKLVPPAMYVADTYMQKHLGLRSDLKSHSICAGIRNGAVSGIGSTEISFNTDDLENYQQMGVNPIVYRVNNGYILDSENTAKVFPRTSLSLIHAREVLIDLENSLYDMLLTYHWKFNTSEVRSQIKYSADKICKDMQEDSALYDYRNVIDTTNNTDYIIDLNMGVLDTYIEIIKGMGIIVNNITVLKKGDIESSGFLS